MKASTASFASSITGRAVSTGTDSVATTVDPSKNGTEAGRAADTPAVHTRRSRSSLVIRLANVVVRVVADLGLHQCRVVLRDLILHLGDEELAWRWPFAPDFAHDERVDRALKHFDVSGVPQQTQVRPRRLRVQARKRQIHAPKKGR